ncbi:MAG: quinolinate synthase NadA [Dehalococcoidia bacterium]|nr:quinolinate synthase NadA [Dehalococcoidia bacterium]
MVTTYKSELAEKISKLRTERKAVILAHNYQRPEIQDIADFVGDSLELSQNAARTDAEVVVFCGVHFMAETASILSPNKKVLMPDLDAYCPMANMITAEQLRERKETLPGVPVVCYVNTSAEVKAESDICCTSANALKVVESVESDSVLFVPDQYLANFIASKTKKQIHYWPGYCPTHARIQAEDILKLKAEYPQAKVMAHPECKPDVIALADEVLGTGGMLRFARQSDAKEFIVGTETGIIYRLGKENPGKKFIAASDKAVCGRMKITTLEKVLWCLEDLAPEVKVPEDIRVRAKAAVDKMLAIGR